jgi:hypothetical protein
MPAKIKAKFNPSTNEIKFTATFERTISMKELALCISEYRGAVVVPPIYLTSGPAPHVSTDIKVAEWIKEIWFGGEYIFLLLEEIDAVSEATLTDVEVEYLP